MVKKILQYIVVFISVGATIYFTQNFLQNDVPEYFKNILKNTYFFHFIFSLFIIIVFYVGSFYEKIQDQLGFLYLGLLVLKIMVYTILFYSKILGDIPMPMFYRASLLIPIFIFLILEVYFISKIIKKK